MNEPKIYGYARVSTKDQNLARQFDAFIDFGIKPELIFADKATGKDFERSEYQRVVNLLQDGDVLVIKSIDRLGRNYEEILKEWRLITTKKRAAIVVLDMPLLDTREKKGDITSRLITDIVLQLLSYVAQVERENIRQRQAEGIAAAQARGVCFGRPKIPQPTTFTSIKDAYFNGCITRKEAANQLDISTSTFDRWIKSDRINNEI